MSFYQLGYSRLWPEFVAFCMWVGPCCLLHMWFGPSESLLFAILAVNLPNTVFRTLLLVAYVVPSPAPPHEARMAKNHMSKFQVLGMDFTLFISTLGPPKNGFCVDSDRS